MGFLHFPRQADAACGVTHGSAITHGVVKDRGKHAVGANNQRGPLRLAWWHRHRVPLGQFGDPLLHRSFSHARTIAEKATGAGRNLTAEEKAAYDRHVTEGREALEEFKRAKSEDEIRAQVKTLAAEIGEPVNVSTDGHRSADRVRGSWAKAAADRMAKTMTMEIDGQKSLITGSIGVPAPIETDIITISEAPRSLLELIPAKGLTGGLRHRQQLQLPAADSPD